MDSGYAYEKLKGVDLSYNRAEVRTRRPYLSLPKLALLS